VTTEIKINTSVLGGYRKEYRRDTCLQKSGSNKNFTLLHVLLNIQATRCSGSIHPFKKATRDAGMQRHSNKSQF
jgi:hypothetical protein